MGCDLLLDEHTHCDDGAHQAARERRAASAPAWGQLWRQELGDDFRDHLDGEPIHCGAGLLLQSRRYGSDEFGEFVLLLPAGVLVHYEIEWNARPGKRAVLYTDVGGLDFMKPIDRTLMRFRWPPKERR